MKKLPRHYWLQQHYEIISIEGKDFLTTPVNEKNPKIKYYCSYESLFDVLFDTHQAIGHGGRDRMIKEVNRRYKNVSQKEIRIFLTLCEPCQRKKCGTQKGVVVKPIISHHLNSRCQVDLIYFQSQPDEEFKFILTYQDHLTKFTLLRPLKCKEAVAVAEQLLDIFLTFGAPCILHSDNGRKFCNAKVTELDKGCRNANVWASVKPKNVLVWKLDICVIPDATKVQRAAINNF